MVALTRPVGFALSAAADFYKGFTPGSGMAAASVDGGLTLVFRLDRSFVAAGASITERGDELHIEATSHEAEVTQQVTRMLGLDADGEAWAAVGQRDPVVGSLQREFPGFFTAAKSSAYDAAAWGVISPRIPMAQAARIKAGIAREYGDVVTIGGASHAVFPSPERLLAMANFPGLAPEKIRRLHGVAEAARSGLLDTERLRALPASQALEELETLPGVGPWTAAHIYFRGAAIQDALPFHEPRVLHGMTAAYGREITEAEALKLSEAWRPFRMWAVILFARHLGRTGGWQRPGLQQERARASRRRRT